MYSDKTQYYEFPQYTTPDIPQILTDFNEFFSKLDNILHQIADSTGADDIAQLQSDVAQLQSDLTALTTRVSTLETTVSGLDTTVNDPTTGIVAQIATITNTLVDYGQRIAALEA